MKLGENLNKTFDYVYVRNLPDAIKRRHSFERSAYEIGLKYTIINSIKGSNYVPVDYQIKYKPSDYPFPANQYLMGNYYTMLYTLLDAMSNNYETIVVCDDDVLFNEVTIDYIKPQLPNDWDMIIMGRMYMNDPHHPISFFKTTHEKFIAGSHCIAIHKKFYFTLLHNMLGMDIHGYFADRLYEQIALRNEVNLYVMLPDITRQDRTTLTPYTIE